MALFDFGIARVHRPARTALWVVYFRCGCDTIVTRAGRSYRDAWRQHQTHDKED